MRLFGSLAALIVLSGCGQALTAVSPTRADPSRTYVVGQRQTANTGDAMLRVRRLYSLPAFTPATEFVGPKAGLLGVNVTFRPGQVWVATAADPQGNFLLAAPLDAGVPPAQALHVTPTGEIGRGWVFAGDGSRIAQARFPDGARLERTEGAAAPGSFAAELVYSGRTGSTIRLLYREYADDLARAAFNQELTYDLSESSQIRFRSIVIDVAEANSSGITYTVVDDGGLDWLPQ